MSMGKVKVLDQPGGKYWCWRLRDTTDQGRCWKSDILTRDENPPTGLQEGCEAVFVGKRTWACSWFSHATLEEGLSDEEIVSSFENYVDWARRFTDHRDDVLENYQEVLHCLIGAEDRWRWSGEPGDRNPPCRCDGCKKNGRILICH